MGVAYEDWRSRFFSREMFRKETIYDKSVAEKLQNVDIVVQCVNPSSAYFKTFPELKNKPMLNIDKGSNGAMTSNGNYIRKRDVSALNAVGKNGAGLMSFAIVLNDTNKGLHSQKICLDAMDAERKLGRILSIDEEVVVDNFVGDTNQQLLVFLGKYHFPAAGSL